MQCLIDVLGSVIVTVEGIGTDIKMEKSTCRLQLEETSLYSGASGRLGIGNLGTLPRLGNLVNASPHRTLSLSLLAVDEHTDSQSWVTEYSLDGTQFVLPEYVKGSAAALKGLAYVERFAWSAMPQNDVQPDMHQTRRLTGFGRARYSVMLIKLFCARSVNRLR